ncbi:uncharacterized protein LOC107879477 [Capsicum annuum]|uniref:uncharacterized protein LOC107879477 n=1 Tax=Capsicum annuum TaxID=4072 RepID=UPI0007BFD01A|nr:uncharacterized protein LOC107879477 [Capsicum annuum]
MADGVQIFELHKELAHISQGPLDIASYFNKIKQLWDDLASLSANTNTACTCGVIKKSNDEQKVFQFLMGLNDIYIQVRNNILMMKPLPSIRTVYSFLLTNEKQRVVSSGSQFSTQSASFQDGVSRHSVFPKVNFDSPRTLSLVRKYCKKPGHTIDKY